MSELKAQIAGLRETWSASMNVILQGKFLSNDKTLSECGLQDGNFLVITGMIARDMTRPEHEREKEEFVEAPDEAPLGFSAPIVYSELPIDQTIDRD